MPDCIEVKRFEKEIATKGKGYVILRRCPREGLVPTLTREVEVLVGLGATQILAASGDPQTPLSPGDVGGYTLTHIHDLLVMERELGADQPWPGSRIQLQPLAQAGGQTWLSLYNQTFFAVPNSNTYGPEELEQCLKSDHDCGFVIWEGTVVGIYELDLGQQPPEISGIGLLPEYQGRGLGRELLFAMLERLTALGHTKCKLLVSTANPVALTLYQKAGFTTEGVMSTWFEVTKKNG